MKRRVSPTSEQKCVAATSIRSLANLLVSQLIQLPCAEQLKYLSEAHT